jgi:hypothetical protein
MDDSKEKHTKLVQVDKGLFVVEDHSTDVRSTSVRQIAKELLRKVEMPEKIKREA